MKVQSWQRSTVWLHLFFVIGLLAACIAPTGAPAQTTDQTTGAEAANYGGTYRAMFGNDAPNLDSAVPGRWQDWWASYTLLHNQLYTYDQDNQFVVELAAALPAVSDDSLVYTIPLRQGVKFHDDTLTTDSIVSQKAVEAAGADWGVKTVIGTGPFKLVEWLPGDKITFERHADYFKPGLPYLDRVELYLNVPEEERVLRWESGAAEYVDYFDGVQAGELPRIQNDPALAPLVRMIATPIFDYLQIADNVAPFTDLRVRQAIAMALDKQALADSTGIGASVPLDDIYTDFLPMYQPDFVSDYLYDPAAAKQLLIEAGFPDGIKNVDMYVDFHPYQGAIVQADLAKIGIEVNLLDGEPALYQDKINSGEIPLVFTGIGPNIMDAYPFVTWVLYCAGDAPPSRSQYCNDETQQLFNQSNTLLLTDPKRNELFQRIQEIVVNEAVYLIPVYKRNVLGLGQSYVKNETYFMLPLLEEVYLER